MTLWTAEQDDILRSMHARGFSFSQIGAELAVTRNAAIGRAGRLHLLQRGKEFTKVKRPYKPHVPKQYPRPNNNSVSGILRRLDLSTPLPPERLDDQAIPHAQRKQLFELEPHHCRYPIGEPGKLGFFFCGGPADLTSGRPYCPYHHKISRQQEVKCRAA